MQAGPGCALLESSYTSLHGIGLWRRALRATTSRLSHQSQLSQALHPQSQGRRSDDCKKSRITGDISEDRRNTLFGFTHHVQSFADVEEATMDLREVWEIKAVHLRKMAAARSGRKKWSEGELNNMTCRSNGSA